MNDSLPFPPVLCYKFSLLIEDNYYVIRSLLLGIAVVLLYALQRIVLRIECLLTRY